MFPVFSHDLCLPGDIGRGNFSRVKKAIHLLTKGELGSDFRCFECNFLSRFADKVAIKIVDQSRLDSKNLQMLKREVNSLESVQHPYILRLFEVVETLGRVHLVTEFVNGGELYYKIVQNGVYPEYKAAKIFKQIALAVQHMVRTLFCKLSMAAVHETSPRTFYLQHHLGFVHRDIKAENVLVVTEDYVKLGDFGFSTQITETQHLNTFCGETSRDLVEMEF